MNTDDQRLRLRLHEELGALEISPAPVLRVTGRGRAIRTRRRALAIGSVVLVAAGVALSAHVTGGHKAIPPTVTVSAPDPAAPGGVFASGTADGKRWKLAVRNIAADPGTRWCLPAVMVNGRNGDVLFRVGPGIGPGKSGYLADIPGLPGIGAVFDQLPPGATTVSASLPGGRSITVHPVSVAACGQRFRLAGFAFRNDRGNIIRLSVSGPAFAESTGSASASGGSAGSSSGASASLFGPTPPGIWANLDTSREDIAVSHLTNPIGTGTVNGMTWHVRTSLGLFGQCYVTTLRGGPGGGRGQSPEQCMPVAAPPRVAALSPVTIPGAETVLPGYAGLVNPRTAKVEVALSDGIIPPARPVTIAGRTYVAFAIPPGCQVLQLKLFDSAGHMFASTASVPPPG